MELLNNNLIVRFEMDKDVFSHGMLELIRPNMWEFEQNSTGTTYQKQLDIRQTNPQIAEIVVGNANFEAVKVGDRVFTHYLAFDNSQEIDHEGEVLKTMSIGAIFFRILEDESFEMMEDVYLGESILKEEEKTESGIILSAYGAKKEEMKVRITHVPINSPYISVGDIVYTIDDNQYELEVFGKKYVKLNTWHIVAKS